MMMNKKQREAVLAESPPRFSGRTPNFEVLCNGFLPPEGVGNAIKLIEGHLRGSSVGLGVNACNHSLSVALLIVEC